MRCGESPVTVLRLEEEIATFSVGLEGHLMGVSVGPSVQFYDTRAMKNMLGEYVAWHINKYPPQNEGKM